MGYIQNGGGVVDAAFINSGRYEIEIAGTRMEARALLGPSYDPKNKRVKDLAELPEPQLSAASQPGDPKFASVSRRDSEV